MVTLDFLETPCSNVTMRRSLWQEIGREEFDYGALMAALADYAKSHDRITRLLRAGEIIRIKKGLYVFGEQHRRRPYSRELLANLAYGPSFVSLDYALSYHGLIPERVEQVTSVTTGRPRRFDTPVGTFVYRPVPVESFHRGMLRVETAAATYLIASPERALADKVREDRSATLRTVGDAESYLFEDLRIDRESFEQLNLDELVQIADALGSRKAALCAVLLRRTKGGP